MAWLGKARRGMAWLLKPHSHLADDNQGMARRGKARLGLAWLGEAGHGVAFKMKNGFKHKQNEGIIQRKKE